MLTIFFIKNTKTFGGDLIEISGLSDFPLSVGDDWMINGLNESDLEIFPNVLHKNSSNLFGTRWEGVVKNAKGLNDKTIWVVGDSFTDAVKPYLNASFTEIRYLGYWSDKVNDLPLLLSEAVVKPDLIIVVRVERTF